MSNVGAIILGVSALLAAVSGNSISAAVSLAGAFIVLSIGELITVIKDK
jgi:hypothetical protein